MSGGGGGRVSVVRTPPEKSVFQYFAYRIHLIVISPLPPPHPITHEYRWKGVQFYVNVHEVDEINIKHFFFFLFGLC